MDLPLNYYVIMLLEQRKNNCVKRYLTMVHGLLLGTVLLLRDGVQIGIPTITSSRRLPLGLEYPYFQCIATLHHTVDFLMEVGNLIGFCLTLSTHSVLHIRFIVR